MRLETMEGFLSALEVFKGSEISAIELRKISGRDERFCRFLLTKSGAPRIRIGVAFFYKTSEIIKYLRTTLNAEAGSSPGPLVREALAGRQSLRI
jgi:hypothetical protein